MFLFPGATIIDQVHFIINHYLQRIRNRSLRVLHFTNVLFFQTFVSETQICSTPICIIALSCPKTQSPRSNLTRAFQTVWSFSTSELISPTLKFSVHWISVIMFILKLSIFIKLVNESPNVRNFEKLRLFYCQFSGRKSFEIVPYSKLDVSMNVHLVPSQNSHNAKDKQPIYNQPIALWKVHNSFLNALNSCHRVGSTNQLLCHQKK